MILFEVLEIYTTFVVENETKTLRTMKRFNLISALEMVARVLMVVGLVAGTVAVVGLMVSMF